MVRVIFACGHELKDVETGQSAPVCPSCGETRIARVQAPKPKFRGVATGPCCVEVTKHGV